MGPDEGPKTKDAVAIMSHNSFNGMSLKSSTPSIIDDALLLPMHAILELCGSKDLRISHLLILQLSCGLTSSLFLIWKM